MNIISQKAISLNNTTPEKSGTVLAVRTWEAATFFEIDAHFPEMNMVDWASVQHIKIQVAPGIYRDYTPSCWNVKSRTCTLFIEAAQYGPGSDWVKSLQPGDIVMYLRNGATLHRPVNSGKMIVLGDISSVGHFLALQQLAGKNYFEGAIAMNENYVSEFAAHFKWDVQPVIKSDTGGFEALLQWTTGKDLTDCSIYISGHIPTCAQLRSELKKRKDQPYGIRVQGFWR